MSEKEYDMIGNCAGDLSCASALVYQMATSLNANKKMDRVAILTLEGALMSLGKHLEDLSKDLYQTMEEEMM